MLSLLFIDGFKSLDVGAKKKEADLEFEQQRKAVIEAALQEQQVQQSGKATSSKQVVAVIGHISNKSNCIVLLFYSASTAKGH